MSGLNVCMFLGNVGKAESRTANNGNTILNFSLAVNEKWKDQNSGELKERTEWIQCSMFGKRAAALGQYVTKGTQVHVTGKWQTRKWQDKETGKDRYSTECIVQDIQLLGGGKNRQEAGRGRQDDDHGQNGDVFDGPGHNAQDDSDSIPF